MKWYVALVVLIIFSMISFGLSCTRTEEGQKGKIEGSSETTTAESFEDAANEEVGKISPPAEERGVVEEETLGE